MYKCCVFVAMVVGVLAVVPGMYCPDLSLDDKFNSTYRSYFTGDFPARAFVGSGPLLRGGRFEMQAVAVKTPRR